MVPSQLVGTMFLAGLVPLLLVSGFVFFSVQLLAPIQSGVVTRDGEVHRVADGQAAFIFPGVESVHRVITASQEAAVSVTATLADGETATADLAVQFTVVDPEVAYRHADEQTGGHLEAVEELVASTVRDVLSEYTQTTHGARRAILDATEDRLDASLAEWGLQLEAVELEDIERTG